MSLFSLVNRGLAGRLGQRPGDPGADADRADGEAQSVRLPGASMHFLEAGLALTAIATAILIGLGR